LTDAAAPRFKQLQITGCRGRDQRICLQLAREQPRIAPFGRCAQQTETTVVVFLKWLPDVQSHICEVREHVCAKRVNVAHSCFSTNGGEKTCFFVSLLLTPPAKKLYEVFLKHKSIH
jgi:hypothetical protein